MKPHRAIIGVDGMEMLMEAVWIGNIGLGGLAEWWMGVGGGG